MKQFEQAEVQNQQAVTLMAVTNDPLHLNRTVTTAVGILLSRTKCADLTNLSTIVKITFLPSVQSSDEIHRDVWPGSAGDGSYCVDWASCTSVSIVQIAKPTTQVEGRMVSNSCISISGGTGMRKHPAWDSWSRMVGEGEVEPTREESLLSLPQLERLGLAKIGEVLVVHPDQKQLLGTPANASAPG